ncbi:hypothetical protein HDU87_000690 [Geranomyces variabilis]|uniref:Uncharacterized protein n=1 Tax=Geranomyces variabilis TaxID=109894 RepID=A0AAD5XPK2_9FUNG|nr:hypothetical protein HDU87_000690 [Geranomyces variabilis]
MYVEFLTGIRTAQENCHAVDSKLYEQAQQFSTACMWATFLAAGELYKNLCRAAGWVFLGSRHVTDEMSKLILEMRVTPSLDDDADCYICEISAQIPGHKSVVFYRHKKEAHAHDTMYSAVKILAKTLGTEEETIKQWVLCSFEYKIRDAPAAQNLWPGPEIVHIPKAILKPTIKRTGLSPAILDSMSRLRQADRYQHTEGLWLPFCRIAQQARATSRLIALPLLYSALCIQFSKQLKAEPLASVIDVETWATNNFTFMYEAGDGLVDMKDVLEGRPLSVKFFRRNGSSAEFPVVELLADDT